MDAQSLFWRCINEVVENHGFDKPEFYGFMADKAQANWNVVREI